MLLKNVKVECPKTIKLQAKSGSRYVYHVGGKEYKSDKQNTVDKRVCIEKNDR